MDTEDNDNCVSDIEYISKNIIDDSQSIEINNKADYKPLNPLPTNFISDKVCDDDDDDDNITSSDTDSDIDNDLLSTTINVNNHKNMISTKEDGEISSQDDLNTSNLISDSNEFLINDILLDPNVSLTTFGTIQAVVANTIVVKALPMLNLLDIQTSVFLQDRTHIGQICDIFGRVESPFYNIIIKKSMISLINIGSNVFHPNHGESVNFIDMKSILNNNVNKIDNDSKVDDSSKKYVKSMKNPQKTRRNRNEQNSYNRNMYMNAWPPSMDLLRNNYGIRTFYKYGQWPSNNDPSH